MSVNNDESEEMLVESHSSVTRTTTISELPGKSYGVTIEVPLFLTMMGLALSGIVISLIIIAKKYIISVMPFNTW